MDSLRSRWYKVFCITQFMAMYGAVHIYKRIKEKIMVARSLSPPNGYLASRDKYKWIAALSWLETTAFWRQKVASLPNTSQWEERLFVYSTWLKMPHVNEEIVSNSSLPKIPLITVDIKALVFKSSLVRSLLLTNNQAFVISRALSGNTIRLAVSDKVYLMCFRKKIP